MLISGYGQIILNIACQIGAAHQPHTYAQPLLLFPFHLGLGNKMLPSLSDTSMAAWSFTPVSM